MNYLIVLSGGVGTRMMADRPKQYLEVNGKPIIQYTLECFDYSIFHKVIVVVSDDWKDFVRNMIVQNFDGENFLFASAGMSRQESVLNGLRSITNITDEDIVVIHDAARACLNKNLVVALIDACKKYDGAMPVLPVKDTIYLSKDALTIGGLLKRDELFAGQAPEAFNLRKYLKINEELSKEELELVRGSSEIAYKNNMTIGLIKGDENNFKITTPNDLERFKSLLDKEEC